MKVAMLIAGAGGMYCGSCLRDNRLAGKLLERGCDVAVIPLYTPLRTDEPDQSNQPIQYGGINVFLQQKSAVFRRMPRFVANMLDSPGILRWAGKTAANTRPESLGTLTVSVLAGQDGAQQRELDRLVEGLRRLGPSLINLPNLMFAGVADRLKRELGVPVLCNLAGEDVFLDGLPHPHKIQAYELIRAGSRCIDAFVAPTRYYANRARERFGVDHARIHHVPLGIRTADFTPPDERAEDSFTIGYLARVAPEKGLDKLCEAFAALRQEGRECRLRVAGYLNPGDTLFLDRIRQELDRQGFAQDVDFVGEVSREEKIEYLHSLHVLSVPTNYPEAKGLFVLEALAAGIPVVQPNQGSFPELIEATGGGILYDAESSDGLRNALATLMDDPERRQALATAGRDAVCRLHSDDVMADHTLSVYDMVLGGSRQSAQMQEERPNVFFDPS